MPQPTTTIDVDRASVYPVDPITLEAVAGFDPIPVGDWAWGISSENGSWLALNVGRDFHDNMEMNLIDIDNWAVASTWSNSIDSPLHLTDDGTIYLINGSTSPYHLSRMVPGEVSPVVVADLPDHMIWFELHINDGLAMIFGLISPDDDYKGEGVLVTVELATGVTNEIPLPGVEVGTVGELELPQNGSTSFDAYPAVVWDDERSRVFIVDVNRDMVTEVSATTGEVIEHQFGSEASNSKPTADGPFTSGQRSAALGHPSGSVLYVASATLTFELVDDYLTVNLAPEGIETIDTSTWEVIDRLDEPISEIHLSSAGDRLLASGQQYTDTADTQESTSSGLYVIDPVDLVVVAHHDADQVDQYFGNFSFSPDSSIGYVTTWDQLTNLNVISLETGEIVATRSAPDIQFFATPSLLIEASPGR